MLALRIKKLSDEAILPTQAYDEPAGFDFYTIKGAVIPPHTTIKFSTGIAAQPPRYYFGQINERSGLGSKGLAVRGGVIDRSYTGEIMVMLCNTTSEPIQISKHDKICQVIYLEYGQFQIVEVDELEETDRGDKGFGSSGL